MSAKEGLFPELDTARHGSVRLRNPLFLGSILRQAAINLSPSDMRQKCAHDIFIKWADMESEGKLRKKKETELRRDFITDIFVTALGYTPFAANSPAWEIRDEYKLPDGKSVDAVIGHFGQDAAEKVFAAIELKGPTVDVDRDRFAGRTAVDQCWDYLVNLPETPWGIVCNYVSFRIYHRQSTRYRFQHFTLQSLRDEREFARFWVIFEKYGLLPVAGLRVPRAESLLNQSNERQMQVSRDLYREYHDNHLMLVQHLRKEYGKTVDQAIHIAQMLLDRIIFVAFCEDRGLLPGNFIEKTYETISYPTLVTNPRWQNFLHLFESVDKGNLRFNITGYDGGLFRKDDEVDNLQLDDRWTDFFRRIGGFDFRDEVNVDVLGHIFEQSITDLEKLRADPDAIQPLGPDQKNGKRKREGVYYTPQNITRYIVENTVGQVIQDRFNSLAGELGISGEDKSGKSEEKQADFDRRRLEILKSIRVLDPACGSGAFLIEAYEFFEAMYEDVIDSFRRNNREDEAANLKKDVKKIILRENLHGVDLSPEAVEIARLSLWIRTAELKRTLDDLSGNVQCGNSLVDAPSVDPAAFDWKARFPKVFAEGGFDCIIGNPPYVKLQNFRRSSPEIAAYLVKQYKSAGTGNFDMYLPFIERGLGLLKPQGVLGFIAPNVWLVNEYGQGLRELIKKRKSLHKFVDFKSFQVFEEVTNYTAIQLFTAKSNKVVQAADASDGNLSEVSFYPVSYSSLDKGAWALLPDVPRKIIEKMRANSVTLEEATDQIFQGLITSADSIYHLRQLGVGRYYSFSLEKEVELDEGVMKPLVSGEDAVDFATPVTDKYLLFPYKIGKDECRLYTAKEMVKQFPRSWRYLRANEKALRAREFGAFDDDEWHRFGRIQNMDKQEFVKIGVPQTVNKLSAFIDPKGALYFNNVRVNGILERPDGAYSLWYLLGLLNSRAMDFCFRLTSKPKSHGYFEANKQFIAPLPVPKAKDQSKVGGIAKKLSELCSKRNEEMGKVHRRFAVDLPPAELIKASPLPVSLSGRLRNFTDYPTVELLKEMEKLAGRKFRPVQRGEWDAFLAERIRKIAAINRQIDDMAGKLNEAVYELYGLDRKDIEAVEEALNHS